jgi:hypothetical protein
MRVAALLALVLATGCFGQWERVETHIVVLADGDDPAAAAVMLHADAFWTPRRCFYHGQCDGEGGRLSGLPVDAGSSSGELVRLAEPEAGRYFATTTGYSTEYAIVIDGDDAYTQEAPEYFTAEVTYDRATGNALVTFDPPLDDSYPRNEDLGVTVYDPTGARAWRCNVEPVREGNVIEVPECLLAVSGEHTLVLERHVYDSPDHGDLSTAEITVERRLTLDVPLPSAPSPRPAAP